MISCVETLDMDAIVEDADRVEWAENSGSNPAFSKDIFNHLAMVEEVTGWWGGTIAKKSWAADLLVRKGRCWNEDERASKAS